MFFLLIFFSSLLTMGTGEFIRGCYIPNWVQNLTDKYVPELCTHVFLAFATMDKNFAILPGENDENGWKLYERTTGLKKIQPDLKVILAFGGTGFSHDNAILLEKMGENAENRRTFVESASKLLKKYNFDGINIDWQYPTFKEEYTTFLSELKNAFKGDNLLLTVAVSGKLTLDKINNIYDIAAVVPYVDMLNVICYNFHEPNEPKTGFTSPLIGTSDDVYSIKNAAELWARGFDKTKIVIGLPTYANGWKLLSSDDNKIGAKSNGPSPPIPSGTNWPGVASYSEICDMIQKGAIEVYDVDQESPYLQYNNLWYSYENERSYRAKTAWIESNGYGGAFVWALNHDDPDGTCSKNSVKFPLTNILKSFKSPVVSDTSESKILATIPVTSSIVDSKVSVTIPVTALETFSTSSSTFSPTNPAITIQTTPSFSSSASVGVIAPTIPPTLLSYTKKAPEDTFLPVFTGVSCFRVGNQPHEDPQKCQLYYKCDTENAKPILAHCPAVFKFNMKSGSCDLLWNGVC